MVDDLARAETLLDLNRPSEAESIVRTHLATDPASARALRLLAQTLVEQDRGPDAVPVARNAVAADPDREQAHRLLAIAYKSIGHREKAVDAAREAVRLAPYSWQAQYTLGASLRGHWSARQEALAVAREAVRLAPHEAAAHNLVGLCLSDLDHKAAAEKAYEDALRADPTYAVAMNNLAALRIDGGRLAKASSMLRSGLASDPHEKLLHENYDAVLLRLVRRLYFALLALGIALAVLAAGGAPYGYRAGVALLLLAIYVGMSWLVIRQMPRGSRRHLWGIVGRTSGPQQRSLIGFLVLSAIVVAIGVAPTGAALAAAGGGLLLLRVMGLIAIGGAIVNWFRKPGA